MMTNDQAPSRWGYWFSRNPDKAWGEKFILAFIPYFIAWNYVGQLMGWLNVNTFWNVTQNLALLLPLIVIPAILRPAVTGRAWWDTYVIKMVLWMFIFGFIANYCITPYFFDVLGMVYYFPKLTWTLDPALIGSNQQKIPIGMYINVPAFYTVYHTLAVLMMRRVRSIDVGALNPVLAAVTVVAVASLVTFLEIRMIAGGDNAPYYVYKDMPFMLKYGFLFYASTFFASIPLVYGLDENQGERWPMRKLILEALAAGMLMFLLADFVTHFMPRI